MQKPPASPRPRPPRDIEPSSFFEDWLPALYAERVAARPHAANSPRPTVELRFRLLGEGGGEWDLVVGATSVCTCWPSALEVPVTITQSVDDWRDLVCGPAVGGQSDEAAFDLAPPRGGPLDLLFIDPALRQLVREVSGTIRFELPGYRRHVWSAQLKLGDQPTATPPDATFSIDADAYRHILDGALPPAEAWLAGRARVLGDAQLAMRVAMALLPRFL